MPDALLWINKDGASDVLSRSSKDETRQIRKHVQHERQVKAKAAQDAAAAAVASKSTSPPKSRRVSRSISERSTTPTDQSTKTVALRRKGLRLDTNLPNDTRSAYPPSSQLSASSSAMSPTSQSLRINQTISALPGLDPDELRSLVFFCQRTAPEWSGWRDALFWNKLILQACHLNQSILHGVVALGALHESCEVDKESDEQSSLQKLALVQSSKATRMAVETAASEITALISCVIFICMQNLQDSRTAYQLLKTGHGIISDVDRRLASGDLVITDSEQTVLNGCLRPIIERLRMRFCCIVDIPSALAISSAIRKESLNSPLPMPRFHHTFSSLLEARNQLEEIIDWGQENVDPLNSVSQGLFDLDTMLASWQSALEKTPILVAERYDALLSSKKLLRSAGLAAAILFDTMGTQVECHYDRHIDKFAEIVHLYKEAIGDHSRTPRRVSFGIDSGAIDTLAFVAGRCRDPVIRREAINLLAQTNRLEGDLQGTTGSTIIQELINLEEQGLEVSCAANIPESSRLRIWEDHQYWDNGEIHIFFIKSPYELSQGAEIKQVVIKLPDAALRVPKEGANPGSPSVRLPNVKYGRGIGEFLEETTQTYYQITLSSFFMPMPRL